VWLILRLLVKAFLRYHDAKNWPLLRETLTRMGRGDLIGNGKRHLVPRWQPELENTSSTQRRAGPKEAAKSRHLPAKRTAQKKRRMSKSKARRQK
ncbi:MAG: DUF3362 domain-containing protein, partial [Candidatus Promineifilaceae bacterium]